jgi:hypothetical protein
MSDCCGHSSSFQEPGFAYGPHENKSANPILTDFQVTRMGGTDKEVVRCGSWKIFFYDVGPAFLSCWAAPCHGFDARRRQRIVLQLTKQGSGRQDRQGRLRRQTSHIRTLVGKKKGHWGRAGTVKVTL